MLTQQELIEEETMLNRAVVSRGSVYKCFIIPLATLLAVIGLLVVLRVAAPAVLLSDIALAQGGGNPISYTITGTVWNDLDDDSTFDAGTESGITDTTVAVILYREYSGCVAAATTISGVYTFTNVITGEYQIIEAYGAPGNVVNRLSPTATFTATEVVTPCDPYALANDPPGYASNTPNVQWITLTVGGVIQNRASPSLWGALGTDLGTVDFGDEKANPFAGCNAAYQTKGSGTTINLFELDMIRTELILYPPGNTDNYYHINSIGYNEVDNFIYGCWHGTTSHSTHEFARIDIDGDLTWLMGTADELTGYDKMHAGDINDQGYWVIGHEAFEELRVVDMNPSRPTYLQVVQSPKFMGSLNTLEGEDLAWNGADNEFYHADHNEFDLYRLDFNKSVEQATEVTRTKVVTTTDVTGGPVGAQYFDSEGNFYFYVNDIGGEEGALYKIRKEQIISGGTVTPRQIDTGESVGLNDGAGCPHVVEFEFGDAPDSYEDPVNPARHNFYVGKGAYLGNLHDGDLDAQSSLGADGDDNDGTDDEDGVTLYGADFQSQALGTPDPSEDWVYTLTVEASKDGYLSAWLDWGGIVDDGKWGEPEDQIFTDTQLSAGANLPMFTVAAGDVLTFFPPYSTAIRFRFAPTQSVATSTSGIVADGEVEDYLVWLGGMADLALTKTVVPTEPVHGGTIVTFTVIVTNSGPYSAAGVIVDDPLPTGYSYQTHTVTQGTYETPTGTWSIGTITHGTAVTLVLVAEVRGGDLENIAEVIVSHNPDPDSTPNNHRPEEDDQDSAAVKLLAIGGIVNPVDRVALLTPWIALAVIVVVTGGILLVKRRRAYRR
jgi:uncharacterized repeat protein (TIGR01451 family)